MRTDSSLRSSELFCKSLHSGLDEVVSQFSQNAEDAPVCLFFPLCLDGKFQLHDHPQVQSGKMITRFCFFVFEDFFFFYCYCLVFVSIKRRISGRKEFRKVFGFVNLCVNTPYPASTAPA